MHFKYKIIVLSVLPLLIAVIAIGGIVAHQARALGAEQATVIEENFLASKRAELKHYVELALTSMGHLYASGGDDEAAKAQAKALLTELNYGEDGYFFVYDMSGNNLVHPRKPELVGSNLWNLTDPSGRPVIQRLLRAAKEGYGFERYAWEKPSSGQMTEKLGYVVSLDRWGWMLGTGIYLDDVERATADVRAQTRSRIEATMGALAVIAGVSALLVFAGGLALNISEQRQADARLKRLAQDIVHLQEAERARVSRELHDGISQVLVSIKYHVELAQEKLSMGTGDPRTELSKGIAGLSDAIVEIRRISHDLRPSLLDELGLPSALRQLGEEFSERTEIETTIVVEGGSDLAFSNSQAVTLFRIAQEALTNVERHAGATAVKLALRQNAGMVEMSISDNGKGFDINQIDRPSNRGIGLRNIRERIEHHGGLLTLYSRPGRTELVAQLPGEG